MEDNAPKPNQQPLQQPTQPVWDEASRPASIPTQPPSQPLPPKKSRKKLWALLLVLLLLVAGGAAAWYLTKDDQKKAPATPAQLTKVTMHMGWLHQAQFAGFYVAKEKGFYRDAGLDVELKPYDENQDLNQEISDGTTDFATSTPLEVIAARDEGLKVKAIAAIYQTSPYCFVSPKTSNIKTPADLKGKVLGYVGNNTEAQVAYPALLSGYGISKSQVTVKTVDFDIVKVFKDKDADTADVYRTDQTFQLDKAGIEYNILLPEQFGFGLYGDVILASDDTVKNRPQIAEKFTQATLKGVQYALDHQDEALTMTAKYEDDLYKDKEYEAYILKNSVPLIKPTGNQPLGNMEFVPWNRAYEAIKSAGQIKNGFNVTEAYTVEFIN